MNIVKQMKMELKQFYAVTGVSDACETCKAEPYMIDENCDTCWNCSHDLGILRWDNNGTPYQI